MRLFLILFIVLISLNQSFAIEGGYADKRSYTKGETAKFYISTKNTNFDISIYKLNDSLDYVQMIKDVKGFEQPSDDSSFYYGFNWQVTYSFKIPDSWSPGAYRFSFPTSEGSKAFYIFVKEKVPGSYSDILLILSDNTWAAYNSVGGKSLYNYNSTNQQNSVKVTFHRPPSGFLGETDFLRYESEFIKWMDKKNHKIEIVSQYDVHSNPNLLKNYKVVFIVGHNEYWSRPERLNIENFVNGGGKLIILSGNTAFWQVRFEDDGKTLVCYKKAALDPLRGTVDSLVTVRWYESPVNYPENPLTGVGFNSGGYVNNNPTTLPASQGYGDYAAYNTYHWIFEGTGLQEGDEFGYEDRIVGGEVDGANFNWVNGVPVVNGSDKSPLHFKIFGISPAKHVDFEVLKTGTMGMYINENKGAVFNAATIRWPSGLRDNIVDRITYNVFKKFYANKLPPEITFWEPSDSVAMEINQQDVFINRRMIKYQYNKPVNFKIQAESHSSLPVKYLWKINNKVEGTSNTFSFTSKDSSIKFIDVVAYAYNSEDTSSITFKIVPNMELYVTSRPDTLVEGGKDYAYQIKTYNMYNDVLTYELVNSPSWLKVNSTGLISGRAPQEEGVSSVTYRVKNKHNQTDEHTYNLYVRKSGNTITEVSYTLNQNYPNPFNPGTTISFSIQEKGNVVLELFNLLGEKVAELINQEMDRGNHEVQFNIENKDYNLSSGFYIYTLRSGNFVESKKLMILK